MESYYLGYETHGSYEGFVLLIFLSKLIFVNSYFAFVNNDGIVIKCNLKYTKRVLFENLNWIRK